MAKDWKSQEKNGTTPHAVIGLDMEKHLIAANLSLYALSLIFPYGSYIGTLAKGIGNSLEKLINFRGDHIDLGGGSPAPRRGVSDSNQGQRCGTGRC